MPHSLRKCLCGEFPELKNSTLPSDDIQNSIETVAWYTCEHHGHVVSGQSAMFPGNHPDKWKTLEEQAREKWNSLLDGGDPVVNKCPEDMVILLTKALQEESRLNNIVYPAEYEAAEHLVKFVLDLLRYNSPDPIGYVKMWDIQHETPIKRARIDFKKECEPWLNELNPKVIALVPVINMDHDPDWMSLTERLAFRPSS